ncbi:hypothetical protein ACTNES_17155 [Blautia sp. HCP3S3_D9]|uniref:hypothetical protein n=1 Tax=Blautia sp. HCP3S3_D9 TaxID=3438912 RepID=UPI003F8C1452
MILNRGPPSGFETSNEISNSGGTDMYIEHPYFYEGKYYANIDGEMIKITKEVAYAMNNFYRSSKAKKVEIKNELGKSWIRCCGRYLTVDSLLMEKDSCT